MPSPKRRNPKAYNGTRTTTHQLKELLPSFLQEMGGQYQSGALQVLSYWEEMMGPTLSPFARADIFAGGVLTVKVLNTTLFALLSKQEKPKLLKRLREAFPNLPIKTIDFKIG